MKLLVFVLGDIHKRLVRGKREPRVFKEDVVFFGPIGETEYIFKDKLYPVVQVFEETSIFSVLGRLPGEWTPDLVICETPVLCYVPDIYRCPIKLQLIPRDAWGEMIFNRGMVNLFDTIHYKCIDRDRYSHFNSKLIPVSGVPITMPQGKRELKQFNKRKIDILAIASLSAGFYHPRYKLYWMIARELGKDYRVRFLAGIDIFKIHDYYAEAKIVVDLSYVLSQRGYEACLNKCLFFSYQSNRINGLVWKQDEEYISYDFSNVIGKLKYYLENPEESQAIINAAYMRYKVIPHELRHAEWTLSQDIDVQARIDRVDSMEASELAYIKATPLYFNYNYSGHNHPKNWRSVYFQRIDDAIDISERQAGVKDTYIKALIEATRFAYLLNDIDLFEQYLNKTINVLPEYPWSYYMKATRISSESDIKSAIDYFNIAIERGIDSHELLDKYPLPFNRKGDVANGRMIGQYMWDATGTKVMCSQFECLMYKCYYGLGKLYESISVQDKAVESYIKASEFVLIPECVIALTRILMYRKEYSAAIDQLVRGLEENPYDIPMNLTLARCYALKNGAICGKKYLVRLYLTLKCFRSRKHIPWKLLVLSLLFFPIFSGELLSSVIDRATLTLQKWVAVS